MGRVYTNRNGGGVITIPGTRNHFFVGKHKTVLLIYYLVHFGIIYFVFFFVKLTSCEVIPDISFVIFFTISYLVSLSIELWNCCFRYMIMCVSVLSCRTFLTVGQGTKYFKNTVLALKSSEFHNFKSVNSLLIWKTLTFLRH